jgi:hypothetical protein
MLKIILKRRGRSKRRGTKRFRIRVHRFVGFTANGTGIIPHGRLLFGVFVHGIGQIIRKIHRLGRAGSGNSFRRSLR